MAAVCFGGTEGKRIREGCSESAFEKDVERYLADRHQSGTFHGMIEVPFMKCLIRKELGVKGSDLKE